MIYLDCLYELFCDAYRFNGFYPFLILMLLFIICNAFILYFVLLLSNKTTLQRIILSILGSVYVLFAITWRYAYELKPFISWLPVLFLVVILLAKFFQRIINNKKVHGHYFYNIHRYIMLSKRQRSIDE